MKGWSLIAIGLVWSLFLSGIAAAEWRLARPDDFTRGDGIEGDLRGISFVDDNVGWAVGDNGIILQTTDGGATWIRHEMPDPPEGFPTRWLGAFKKTQLWRVRALDADTVWIVGSGGVAIVTRDGGQTWTLVDSQASRSRLVDVLFVSEKVGFLTGDNSHIIRTEDGGATWKAVVSGERAVAGDNRIVYEGIAFATPTFGWAVGSTGTVVYTEDGGITWQPPGELIDAVENLYGITFVTETDGWIVGQEATVLHTTDGRNWERVENEAEDEYYDLFDIAFDPTDPKRGWIVGDGGTILVTTDGGETWTLDDSGVNEVLHAITVTPSGHAFIAGSWGIILTNAPAEGE